MELCSELKRFARISGLTNESRAWLAQRLDLEYGHRCVFHMEIRLDSYPIYLFEATSCCDFSVVNNIKWVSRDPLPC